jgi:plasmid stabilization system protein ParE
MVKTSSLKISWDRKALDNLKEILTYLAKQDAQAPKIVKSAIISRLDIIKTNPLICESDKLKDPTHKDFRAFVIFSYRVTYQIKSETKELRVQRIRHTSREPLGY